MKKVKTIEPLERCFEDFPQGFEFPIVDLGQMSVGHQVIWAGACDNYHAEFHHDESIAKAQGLPGIVMSGPFFGSRILTQVGIWLGKNARLVSFYNRNAAPVLPGNRLRITARISKTEMCDDLGVLELECAILNENEQVTTPARATASIPTRKLMLKSW
jgi:acyl dehydratase